MNSFNSSDQADFDKISRGLNSIDNNITRTNETLRNEFNSQKGILSSIGNGIASVGRGISSGYNAIKQDYGVNMSVAKPTYAAMAAGPIGVVMQDIFSKIGNTFTSRLSRDKNSIENLMNKFHGHGDAIEKLGGIQQQQSIQQNDALNRLNQTAKTEIAQNKVNTDEIVSAIRRSNNERPVSTVPQHQAPQTVTLPPQLLRKLDTSTSNSPGDIASAMSTIIKNQEKMNEMFTDPNAAKTGIMHTLMDLGTTFTGIKFWFSGRYAKDIQRSSNPLATMTDALIKIYEWQRIGLDLQKRQLNELIKAAGGVPQKEVGHESAAKAFLKKKAAQINQWYDRSAMSKIPILGKLGKLGTSAATMFMGFSDEDWADYAYAKGHSMLDSMSKERSIKKVSSHFYDPHNVNRYKSALGADLSNSEQDAYMESTIKDIRKIDKRKFNNFKNDDAIQEAIDSINEIGSREDISDRKKKKMLKAAFKNLKRQSQNAEGDYGLGSLSDPLYNADYGDGLLSFITGNYGSGHIDRILAGEKITADDIFTYTEDTEDTKKKALLETLKEKISKTKDPNKRQSLLEKYYYTAAALEKDKLDEDEHDTTSSVNPRKFSKGSKFENYDKHTTDSNSGIIVDRLTDIQAILQDIDYNIVDRIATSILAGNKNLSDEIKNISGSNILDEFGNPIDTKDNIGIIPDNKDRSSFINQFKEAIHISDRDRSGLLTEGGEEDEDRESIRDDVRLIAQNIKKGLSTKIPPIKVEVDENGGGLLNNIPWKTLIAAGVAAALAYWWPNAIKSLSELLGKGGEMAWDAIKKFFETWGNEIWDDPASASARFASGTKSIPPAQTAFEKRTVATTAKKIIKEDVKRIKAENPNLNNNIKKLKSEVTKMEKAHPELGKNISTLFDEKIAHEQFIKKYEKTPLATEGADKIHEEIKQRKQRILEIDDELKKLNETQTKLQELKKQLKTLETTKSDIKVKQAKIKELSRKIADAQDDINRALSKGNKPGMVSRTLNKAGQVAGAISYAYNGWNFLENIHDKNYLDATENARNIMLTATPTGWTNLGFWTLQAVINQYIRPNGPTSITIAGKDIDTGVNEVNETLNAASGNLGASSINAVKIVQNMIASGTFGKTGMEIAGASMALKRFTPVFNVVNGVVTGWHAWQAYENGDNLLAVVQGCSAAASITAAATGLFAASGGTAAVVSGAAMVIAFALDGIAWLITLAYADDINDLCAELAYISTNFAYNNDPQEQKKVAEHVKKCGEIKGNKEHIKFLEGLADLYKKWCDIHGTTLVQCYNMHAQDKEFMEKCKKFISAIKFAIIEINKRCPVGLEVCYKNTIGKLYFLYVTNSKNKSTPLERSATINAYKRHKNFGKIDIRIDEDLKRIDKDENLTQEQKEELKHHRREFSLALMERHSDAASAVEWENERNARSGSFSAVKDYMQLMGGGYESRYSDRGFFNLMSITDDLEYEEFVDEPWYNIFRNNHYEGTSVRSEIASAKDMPIATQKHVAAKSFKKYWDQKIIPKYYEYAIFDDKDYVDYNKYNGRVPRDETGNSIWLRNGDRRSRLDNQPEMWGRAAAGALDTKKRNLFEAVTNALLDSRFKNDEKTLYLEKYCGIKNDKQLFQKKVFENTKPNPPYSDEYGKIIRKVRDIMASHPELKEFANEPSKKITDETLYKQLREAIVEWINLFSKYNDGIKFKILDNFEKTRTWRYINIIMFNSRYCYMNQTSYRYLDNDDKPSAVTIFIDGSYERERTQLAFKIFHNYYVFWRDYVITGRSHEYRTINDEGIEYTAPEPEFLGIHFSTRLKNEAMRSFGGQNLIIDNNGKLLKAAEGSNPYQEKMIPVIKAAITKKIKSMNIHRLATDEAVEFYANKLTSEAWKQLNQHKDSGEELRAYHLLLNDIITDSEALEKFSQNIAEVLTKHSSELKSLTRPEGQVTLSSGDFAGDYNSYIDEFSKVLDQHIEDRFKAIGTITFDDNEAQVFDTVLGKGDSVPVDKGISSTMSLALETKKDVTKEEDNVAPTTHSLATPPIIPTPTESENNNEPSKSKQELAHGGLVKVANTPQYGTTTQGTPYVWGEAGPEAEIPLGGGNTMYLPLTRRKGNLLDQLIETTQSKLKHGGLIHAKDLKSTTDNISKNKTSTIAKFKDGAIARVRKAADDILQNLTEKSVSVQEKMSDETTTIGKLVKDIRDLTKAGVKKTGEVVEAIYNSAQNDFYNDDQYEKEYEYVTDESGKPTNVIKKDEKGKPIYKTDENGNPIYKKDASGNLILKNDAEAAWKKTFVEDMDALSGKILTDDGKVDVERLKKIEERWFKESTEVNVKGETKISKETYDKRIKKIKQLYRNLTDTATQSTSNQTSSTHTATTTQSDFNAEEYIRRQQEEINRYHEERRKKSWDFIDLQKKSSDSKKPKKQIETKSPVVQNDASDSEKQKKQDKSESHVVQNDASNPKKPKKQIETKSPVVQINDGSPSNSMSKFMAGIVDESKGEVPVSKVENKKESNVKVTDEDEEYNYDDYTKGSPHTPITTKSDHFTANIAVDVPIPMKEQDSDVTKLAGQVKGAYKKGKGSEQPTDTKKDLVDKKEENFKNIDTVVNNEVTTNNPDDNSTHSDNKKLNEFWDTIKNWSKDVGSEVVSGVEYLTDEAKKRAPVLKKKAVDVASTVGEKAKNIKGEVVSGVEYLTDEAKKRAPEIGEKTKRLAEDVKDKVINGAESFKKIVDEKTPIVKQKVGEVASTVGQSVIDGKDKVVSDANAFKEKIAKNEKLTSIAHEFADKNVPIHIFNDTLDRLGIEDEFVIRRLKMEYDARLLDNRQKPNITIKDGTTIKQNSGSISQLDIQSNFSKSLSNPIVNEKNNTVTIGNTTINKDIWDNIQNINHNNIKNLDIKHLSEHFDYKNKKDSKFGTLTDSNYLSTVDKLNEKNIISKLNELDISEVEKQILIEKFTNKFRQDARSHYNNIKNTDKEKLKIIEDHLTTKKKEETARKSIYDKLSGIGTQSANNISLEQLHKDFASNIDNVIQNNYMNRVSTPILKSYSGINDYHEQLINEINDIYTPEQKKKFISELTQKFYKERTDRFKSVRDTDEFKQYHSDYIQKTGSLDYIFPKSIGFKDYEKYKVGSIAKMSKTEFASGGIAHAGSSVSNNAVNYISDIVANNIRNQFASGGIVDNSLNNVVNNKLLMEIFNKKNQESTFNKHEKSILYGPNSIERQMDKKRIDFLLDNVQHEYGTNKERYFGTDDYYKQILNAKPLLESSLYSTFNSKDTKCPLSTEELALMSIPENIAINQVGKDNYYKIKLKYLAYRSNKYLPKEYKDKGYILSFKSGDSIVMSGEKKTNKDYTHYKGGNSISTKQHLYSDKSGLTPVLYDSEGNMIEILENHPLYNLKISEHLRDFNTIRINSVSQNHNLKLSSNLTPYLLYSMYDKGYKKIHKYESNNKYVTNNQPISIKEQLDAFDKFIELRTAENQFNENTKQVIKHLQNNDYYNEQNIANYRSNLINTNNILPSVSMNLPKFAGGGIAHAGSSVSNNAVNYISDIVASNIIRNQFADGGIVGYFKNKASNYISKNVISKLNYKLQELSPEISNITQVLTNNINTITNKVSDGIDHLLPKVDIITNEIISLNNILKENAHVIKENNTPFNLNARTAAMNTAAMNTVINNSNSTDHTEQILKGMEKSNNSFAQSTMNLIKNTSNTNNCSSPVINNYHECDKTFRMVESFGIIQ